MARYNYDLIDKVCNYLPNKEKDYYENMLYYMASKNRDILSSMHNILKQIEAGGLLLTVSLLNILQKEHPQSLVDWNCYEKIRRINGKVDDKIIWSIKK